MIQRKILKDLLAWKSDKNKKPLILKGARQVGKSFIVKEFAKTYNNYFEINFQNNKDFCKIFDGNINAKEIIKKIEFHFGKKIDLKNDLIFLDEIQDCPKAINSLKFFNEELKELDIIGAGSYLGLIKSDESFPVGKVEFLSMFPLNFEEFLRNTKPELFEIYKKFDLNNMKKVDDFYHEQFLKHINLFFIIGGMPEIVDFYIENKNKLGEFELFEKLRKKQLDLINSYKIDFTKYSKMINSSKILNVYEAIASQLSKSYDEEVDKFKFSGVIPNQKGFERIIGPLSWLSSSRLVIKNFIISNISHPLKSFIEQNKFKLFYHDNGLLNASLNTPIKSILFEELGNYKGFILENFIATELYNYFDDNILSWQKASAEVEFIFEKNGEIIPLEVKSSKKSRKAKSLDSFITRYSPKYAYKLTSQNYGYNKERKIYTLPIYLIGKILRKY